MKKPYYFIAIGGIGMSGLAKYLLESGEMVLGSDICKSKYTKKLEDMGAKIFIGHDESNLPEDAEVIVSSAIKESNPELQKAKRLGLNIYHRSDLLAQISNGKKECFIGFAGTHGKTTTSGLASYVLNMSGLNPSFVVGGIVPELNTNAIYSDGKYFIAELDESDGTIIKYRPNICVINNLEKDHTDFYKNGLASLVNTFSNFINNLNPDSKLIINNDNSGNLELIKLYPNVITFGLNKADYVAKNISYGSLTSFDVYKGDEFVTNIKLSLSGEHNVYNALGVAAAFMEAGEDMEKIKPYFESFSGMGRRLQKSAQIGEISVYDDYAHHPTEIKATLSALRLKGYKNIVAVFQPHRYTRLHGLWDEFKTCFANADKVYGIDVYPAGESSIEGYGAKEFCEQTGYTYLKGDLSEVADELKGAFEEGDLVLCLGAGSIVKLTPMLKDKI